MTADDVPKQQAVLGFPARPGGDADQVRLARHPWYELADEINRAFEDIDRVLSATTWSGRGREAFDRIWHDFLQHVAEAEGHSRSFGDHLLMLANRIEDAQHEWDMAMLGVVASTGVGVGLTVLTFGISDVPAETAATGAVAAMEATCAALDMAFASFTVVLEQAARIGIQLAGRFILQFAINVLSQETSHLIEGKGLGDVDALQAGMYALAATVVPGASTHVHIGGKAVFSSPAGAAAFDTASAVAIDAGVQGVEDIAKGHPLNLDELAVTGSLALLGHGVGGGLGRLGREGQEVGSGGGLRPVTAQEFRQWLRRSDLFNAKLDASIDAKLQRTASGETVGITRTEAKRLLIRENINAADPERLTERKVKRALRLVKGLDGPITIREWQPGTALFRYADAQGSGRILTPHEHYRTSSDAERALGMVPGNHAWLKQKVTCTEPRLVMGGTAVNGTAPHIVVVHEEQMRHLHFHHAERFGSSAAAAETAADAGRLPHDAGDAGQASRRREPDLRRDVSNLRDDADHLGDDARRL